MIRYFPYIHTKSSLEKNLSLYLPIGAWFIISLVIYVYIKFEKPKCFSQVLSLECIKWIGQLLSSFKLRKFLLLYSEAWKYICHLQTIVLYSFFLLNSYDILLDRVGSTFKHFDSLSTNKYRDYLALSEQFQKAIKLLEFLLKKPLRFLDIAIEYS